MFKLFLIFKVSFKLGLSNVLNVLIYRLFLSSLFVKFFFPVKKMKKNKIFFYALKNKENVEYPYSKKIILCADQILKGEMSYFCNQTFNLGENPDWFFNPYNDCHYNNHELHWSKLKDFDKKFGDIKVIWDLSRFNWLGTLACAYKITLDIKYLNKINNLFSNWIESNPLNRGPNWKCGQETSIRIINLILAIEILGKENISKNCIEFLRIHLERINPTVFYAKAQNNNHVISEATALYLVGYFLWINTQEKNTIKYIIRHLN